MLPTPTLDFSCRAATLTRTISSIWKSGPAPLRDFELLKDSLQSRQAMFLESPDRHPDHDVYHMIVYDNSEYTIIQYHDIIHYIISYHTTSYIHTISYYIITLYSCHPRSFLAACCQEVACPCRLP